MASEANERCRLAAVTLDEASIGRGNPDQEHERAIAIYDILEENYFALPNFDGGPYLLHIGLIEKKLCFEVKSQDGIALVSHHLSLTPFRKTIRDYELICDSYYKAIRDSSAAQIEAIDMGRRGLHNEAAELLMKRLDGKLVLDFDTARRIFTLIFALHWKG
ncbi:UPF0262 family protein [Microvirga rosea]|uniref:UPF0262 family protein n=1 Tax=Microvirga rosea TaxID=2715425 RepID=UPI001D0BA35E|nr:UPF0262 family protein [Microvirga rosea]MCB8820510.1 UPF0262 family protein [Microvirga rosea]